MGAPEREGRFEPAVDSLVSGLSEGDPELVSWLRRRARSRAAGRFSVYAWEWIEEDFFS